MNCLVLTEVNGGMSIDRLIVDYFNGLGAWGNFLLVVLSLLISIILGGLLGFQREVNGHSAGLRTHVIFSLSSCLLMVISIYGGLNNIGGEYDTMRLAAGVVAGAGFLGAGTIVHNGVSIKGLTTAATVWMSMAVGVACGCGWWTIAVITTLLTFVVLIGLAKLSRLATKTNTNVMLIVDRDNNAIPTLLEIADQHNIVIKDINTSLVNFGNKNVVRITFRVACRDAKLVQEFLDYAKVNIEPIQLQIIQ